MVLRWHENQPGSGFHRRLLRRVGAGLQDSDNSGVSRDDANSNRGHYRYAENQRHEERNHGQPPCLDTLVNCIIQMPPS
jgi:hypothetical protein